MIKAVLFDLDGTLLPMDQDVFVSAYFKRLAQKVAPLGYEAKPLISAIWGGMAAMVANDGKTTNEDAFWNFFSTVFGPESRKDEPVFTDFYEHEFNEARTSCGFQPMAAEIVHALKDAGTRVILATNPIFPAVATHNRIRWTGLSPEDFELITTYENIGVCKPNPEYYREILRRTGLRPEECLMVGNDAEEDLAAMTCGIPVFLVTDCLINKKNVDISVVPNGGFPELKAYLQKEKAC